MYWGRAGGREGGGGGLAEEWGADAARAAGELLLVALFPLASPLHASVFIFLVFKPDSPLYLRVLPPFP